eukprot:TRINITY_DN3_c0_g1_i1.p1 TRINITY_DN3_c0_g1~~TRINITY_DN3_c0_g1_i1.p1  ORF type:complete len:231 (+),score=75.32 TRINITY_DN3_c0_g1_i1:167-859(+)
MFNKIFALLLILAFANAIQIESDLTKVGKDYKRDCPLCASFMSRACNDLAQIIEQVGVLSSCGIVCSLLPNPLEGQICSLLCDVVGMKEFGRLISQIDPDPIEICMDWNFCPLVEGGEVVVDEIEISPAQPTIKDEVHMDALFTVKNETSTGIIEFVIFGHGIQPFGLERIELPLQPGQYKLDLKFGGPKDQLSAGDYKALFKICSGDCSGKHKHSYIYAQAQHAFTITN